MVFWVRPDWAAGDNLRDTGVQPFWMIAPKRADIFNCNSMSALGLSGSAAYAQYQQREAADAMMRDYQNFTMTAQRGKE